MTRKLLSLVVALCLMLTAFPVLAEVTPAGEFPIVDTPTELTVWAGLPGNGQEPYDTNEMTAWYEEQTGVHINWIEVNSSECDTLFNTSVASGSYPDIYMKSISGDVLLQMAEDGVIIPLNDLIDEYGYYLKQALEAHPELKELITAPDGNIYSFPAMIASYSNNIVPNKLWVYKEWLERYEKETGNPAPDTPESLKEMLAFFRDNDMNGNGDTTDEIIMTGNYNWGNEGSNPVYYLLNAYVFLPSTPKHEFIYVGDDGKMTTDVMSDEFREGLRYAHDLYTEGLLSEEIFVQDLNTMRSLTTSTKDNVIVATAGAPYSPRLLTLQTDVENAVTYEDYVALEPLKGSDGVAVTPTQSLGYYYNMYNVITTACEDPVAAFRWMDFMYSDVVQAYVTYGGLEGDTEHGWYWVDSPSLAGDSKSIRATRGAQELIETVWNGDWCGLKYRTTDLVMAAEASTSATTASWNACNLYLPYAKQSGLSPISWCEDADVAADYASMQEVFTKYVDNSISEFVLGVRDIGDDAAWTEYLSTLEGMHVDQFLKLADSYYSLD